MGETFSREKKEVMKLLMENWRNYLDEDVLEEGLKEKVASLAVALTTMLSTPALAQDTKTYEPLKKPLISLLNKAKKPGGISGNYSPQELDLIKAILVLRKNNPEKLSDINTLQQLNKRVKRTSLENPFSK